MKWHSTPVQVGAPRRGPGPSGSDPLTGSIELGLVCLLFVGLAIPLRAYDLRGESQTVGVLPGGTIDAGVISLIADSDGDGLPDDFEIAVGLDPQDPTDADGDLDGDGLSNLAHRKNNRPIAPMAPG